jgi:5,10-methylenetetrahydrofolate reductase
MRPTSFDVGAVLGFDHSQPEMEEVIIQKKKNAGASYFLTFPVYDSESAHMMADRVIKTETPLIVTIYPIDSIDTANWIGKLHPNSKPPGDFINKIKDIEQSSSTIQDKTRRINEANSSLVDMLVKELRTVKGVSGCNIVSTKLDALKAPSK